MEAKQNVWFCNEFSLQNQAFCFASISKSKKKKSTRRYKIFLNNEIGKNDIRKKIEGKRMKETTVSEKEEGKYLEKILWKKETKKKRMNVVVSESVNPK